MLLEQLLLSGLCQTAIFNDIHLTVDHSVISQYKIELLIHEESLQHIDESRRDQYVTTGRW